MKPVEAVIFDWAGTVVDYGCMAPVQAMKTAFAQKKLNITLDEIRQPMGMSKYEHIKSILGMERVIQLFSQIYGRKYEAADINLIFASFEESIFSLLPQNSHVIPDVLSVQTYLRNKQIKIGSTTGYTRKMINIVMHCAKAQGYHPDVIVAADEVLHGRPHPYMLQQNIAKLCISDVRRVVKVGDTIADIEEGLCAGCWSVGVIKGSSMLGLSECEVDSIPRDSLQKRMLKVKYEMLSAGAHYVIENINELPYVIDVLEKRRDQLN